MMRRRALETRFRMSVIVQIFATAWVLAVQRAVEVCDFLIDDPN